MVPNSFTAGSTLTILMLALPISIISEIVFYFAYGRGDKKAVLYLGLAGNMPRVILYFVLVPTLGADGSCFGIFDRMRGSVSIVAENCEEVLVNAAL